MVSPGAQRAAQLSILHLVGFSLMTKDAARPVANVAAVPITTYQVKAIGVANLMYSITASPAIMAHIAAHFPTRRVKRPNRNTPSSEP